MRLFRRPSLLLLTIVAAAAVRLWIGPHIVDDAYITFRYSERLASGLGFTYNDAEHVLGTTSPLLTLILAAAAAIGLPLPQTSFALSIAADAFSIAAGSLLLRRAHGAVAATLYGLLMAASPLFVTYAVSGLETSLYVALLLLALWLVESDRPVLLGATLAALVLCRADGALMAAFVAARRWRSARVSWVIAAAILAAWTLFALAYFHDVVPTSVRAKAHLRVSARVALDIFLQYFGRGMYRALSVLAAAGVVVLVRRGLVWRVAAVWWVVYATVFIAAGAFSAYPWYFVPLLPVYFAAAAAALGSLSERVRGTRLRRFAAAALVAGTVVFLGWRVVAHRATLDQWGERERLYREIAIGLPERAGCALAATEIGTLGYFHRGPVLDLVGLVSPEAIGRTPTDTIAAAQPCWVVSYSDLLDRPGVPAGYRVTFSHPMSPTRTLFVFERP